MLGPENRIEAAIALAQGERVTVADLRMGDFSTPRAAEPTGIDLSLEAFERAVQACADILECHLMSGDFDYLLRVAVADMRDYERVHRQAGPGSPHRAGV